MNEPSDLELAEFRDGVRAFLHEQAPQAPEFKLPDSFMEVGSDSQFEYLRDWQAKVYAAGYLGLSWPKEYGGHGLPGAFQRIVDVEMAIARVPFMVNVIGLFWAGPTILKLGSEVQKQRYIQKILSAEEIWCQGFSEPDHGSDLASARTTAKRDGEHYVLNGTKTWTSLGAYAQHMILLARTDSSGLEGANAASARGKYQGLSFFLAPMRIPNVTTSKIRKMTGEHGFTETHFEDARVPASCLLGREGEGWSVAMTVLMFERGAEGGQAGGLAMVPLRVEQVVELARTAKRDGRPALEDPAIRDGLVRFAIEERALGASVLRSRNPALAGPRPFAVPMMMKLRMSEFRRRLCAFAVHVQGSNANLYVGDPGALSDGDWQRGYMNAFSATIGGGTSEIQHNILGERMLGLGKG